MSSKKTKPLSDLTNETYNLIPTSTLRKLVNNPKLSASVWRTKHRPDPSSRSETSVGSTNVSSSTVALNPNDATGDKRNKNAEHTQRTQKTEKSNKENESSDAFAAKKRDDKGKAIVEAPSSAKRKQRETCDPCKLILGPPKVDVRTKQKLVSADVAIHRASSSKKPVKTKVDSAVISSCPAIARTKNKKSRKEAESAAKMKSRTEPRPKRGEKNFADFRYGLPRDSIEQQKAYFDVINAFELLVEEVEKVSEDEVD